MPKGRCTTGSQAAGPGCLPYVPSDALRRAAVRAPTLKHVLTCSVSNRGLADGWEPQDVSEPRPHHAVGGLDRLRHEQPDWLHMRALRRGGRGGRPGG